MNDNYIKNYKEKELKLFVIANIGIVLILSNSLHLDDCLNQINSVSLITIVNTSLFSGIIFAFIVFFDLFIGSSFKMKTVYYWCNKPGETIFSDLKNGKYSSDNRFNIEDVKRKYANIFQKIGSGSYNKKELSQYQNKEWYRIYSKHITSDRIKATHRDFLLSRDMSVSMSILFVLYLMSAIFFEFICLSWKSVIYISVVYVLCVVATRVKGRRFVATTIAVDINEE